MEITFLPSTDRSVLTAESRLKKYDYTLEGVLNNKNRWDTKIVCSILDKDFRRYVSTTYMKRNDYLKLLETTAFLNCNKKLSPRIANLCPKDATVICDYIGEFLSDHLLSNPADILLSLTSIFDYLKDISFINQSHNRFVIPSIIRASQRLAEELTNDLEFLPGIKVVLPQLENSGIKFTCGCGIEDPHIWNFRIVKTKDKIRALTTDFDYFSERVNYFWELGYFYATFRWLKKSAFSLACRSEEILLSLFQNQDPKSEFMFWLGALSSYCGYKDSMRNLMMNGGINESREQHIIIQQLDEKVSSLANRLLWKEGG